VKKLVLLRHARTEDYYNSQTDKQRALTEKGLEDATHLGKQWAAENVRFDKVYSSSAVRAQMTVTIVAEKLDYPNSEIQLLDSLYNASRKYLLSFIQQIPDEYQTVLVVNHNPALSELCQTLLNEYVPLLFPCTAMEIAFEIESWQHISSGQGRLLRRLEPNISEY
jgi:phosphohistidine phosphatase